MRVTASCSTRTRTRTPMPTRMRIPTMVPLSTLVLLPEMPVNSGWRPTLGDHVYSLGLMSVTLCRSSGRMTYIGLHSSKIVDSTG